MTKAAKGEPARFLMEVVLRYRGSECLLWPYARVKGGYGEIHSRFVPGYDDQPDKMLMVHRVVCEKVRGKPPSSKHTAAHSCGKGKNGCCAPRHLNWKTQKQNLADRVAHGTETRGERNGQARLTADDVREIRRLGSTATQKAIAAKFSIGRQAVGKIISGERWGSVR